MLLDLNEQEALQLRRRVEELETANDTSKKQIRDLQERVKSNPANKESLPLLLKSSANGNTDKVKMKDKEISELKIKLNEKERAIEKLKTESKVKSSKVTESVFDQQQNVNHKRQLEMVEQEAMVLRSKVLTMEREIENVSTENKKLTVQVARLSRNSNGNLDTKSIANTAELTKVKDLLSKVEKEKDEIQQKLKNVLEIDAKKLPPRIPKKYTDLTTKMQLQKMISDLEDEVKEMRAVVVRTGAVNLQKLEEEKSSAIQELNDFKEQLTSVSAELSKF